MIDLGKPCVLHRVFLTGRQHKLELWDWPKDKDKKPLGVITVFVGDTDDTQSQVGEFMVPYDGGDPIDIEADLRFHPVAGQHVRIELRKAAADAKWNVGELELYGFADTVSPVNSDAVILPKNAAAPARTGRRRVELLPRRAFRQTASGGDGRTHRGIPRNALPDCRSQAARENLRRDDGKHESGQAAGGRQRGAGWPGRCFSRPGPYRCVLWSVWEFLGRQGVRWLYPDSHGDLVPTGKGVSLDILPLRFTPSAWSIYANWNADCFQPWPPWDTQTRRESSLYPWRNRWSCTWALRTGPLGGGELPKPPPTGHALKDEYKEGFKGYPHNFDSVVPKRILQEHPGWQGFSKKEGKRVLHEKYSDPTFCMSNPELIRWVADKMVEVAKAEPLPSRSLALTEWQMAYNLMPMDSARFCECERCLEVNGPKRESRAAYVYERSMSGVYYYFVTEVAKAVRERAPQAVVGALAYCCVNPPPETIKTFPGNTQVEVCVYGECCLPMSSPANAGEKSMWETWRTKCAHLSSYDYALLHTGYYQKDPRLPVPLVTATVDRAKLLHKRGMLNGGCQATPESLPYNPWNFYAYPRIRWNVGQTADQLLKEFFTGYYRGAGEPMLAYYKTLENHLIQNDISIGRTEFYCIVPGSFPRHILSRMKEHLEEAERKADGWIVKRRVANAREGFDWTVERRGLKGVDLNDTSIYPKVGADNNALKIDLSKMRKPDRDPWGNFANFDKSGEWRFGAMGLIETPLNIVKEGKYTVTIVARSVPWEDVWPLAEVWIGFKKAAPAPIASKEDKEYRFDVDAVASVWDLVVAYENAAEGGRRNLFIKEIRVERP